MTPCKSIRVSFPVNSLPPDPYANDPWSWTRVLFRPLPEFPGYGIDTDGNVWSCRTVTTSWRGDLAERWRKTKLHPVAKPNNINTYAYAQFGINQKKRQIAVHRLVLETFLGPPPPGDQCCHFPDRNGLNNRLANLRWGSAGENANDRKIQGGTPVGEDARWAKLRDTDVVMIRELRASGVKSIDVAKRIGISVHTVQCIASGRTWRHVGGPILSKDDLLEERRRNRSRSAAASHPNKPRRPLLSESASKAVRLIDRHFGRESFTCVMLAEIIFDCRKAVASQVYARPAGCILKKLERTGFVVRCSRPANLRIGRRNWAQPYGYCRTEKSL